MIVRINDRIEQTWPLVGTQPELVDHPPADSKYLAVRVFDRAAVKHWALPKILLRTRPPSGTGECERFGALALT